MEGAKIMYEDDYDDLEKYNHRRVSLHTVEEEEEDDELNDNKLANDMDDDLAEYFSDARMMPKKTSKKKKAKVVYKTGDEVTTKQGKGHIIYGPYEVNKKQMYEIELDSGDLISLDDKHISK